MQQAEDSANAYRAATIARERQERLTKASLPERMMMHREIALRTPVDHPWQQKLELLKACIGKPGRGGIYAIVGTYGVGKSQLGAELVYCATQSTSALFIKAQKMIGSIKDTWHSYRESTGSQKDKFVMPRLLCVDEVNAGRYLDETGIDYLQEIITDRFDAQKCTLLLSNETRSSFEALVGERIYDRMNENEAGGIIEANWPSFRKAS